ncbi:MAG TPA: tetratricopeptide repeat protein [Verrucomicrobia bacterium]|nr:tetratricopeptide repeat protein [Verrucomicrobiota bacterium]
MSRFSNLEFGDQSEQAGGFRQGLRDDNHYMKMAVQGLENGDFKMALKHYSRVLEYNPDVVGAWLGQVRMLVELKEYQGAGMWADKALERFPNAPDLLAAKAVTLARSGEADSALAFSDASIEAGGGSAYVWMARGDVLLACREKEQASRFCFEKAVSIEADDWVVPWLISRIYRIYKKFALAMNPIRRAVELQAGHGILWLQLGYCQQDLGLFNAAGQSFTQARELIPENIEIIQALLDHSQMGWWQGIHRRLTRFLTT